MEADKLINTKQRNKLLGCMCFNNYSSLQFGMLTTACKAVVHKCFCSKIIDKLCFDDCVNPVEHECVCEKLFFPSGKIKLCKASIHDCICNISPFINSKNICKMHNK